MPACHQKKNLHPCLFRVALFVCGHSFFVVVKHPLTCLICIATSSKLTWVRMLTCWHALTTCMLTCWQALINLHCDRHQNWRVRSSRLVAYTSSLSSWSLVVCWHMLTYADVCWRMLTCLICIATDVKTDVTLFEEQYVYITSSSSNQIWSAPLTTLIDRNAEWIK